MAAMSSLNALFDQDGMRTRYLELCMQKFRHCVEEGNISAVRRLLCLLSRLLEVCVCVIVRSHRRRRPALNACADVREGATRAGAWRCA